MRISEFLAGAAMLTRLRAAQDSIRNGGGNGDLVITLSFKENRLMSGKVNADIGSGRIDANEAKPFQPE